MHHDAQIVMGCVVPAYGVDERHVPHKSVFLYVAAIVKSLVQQIVADHRHVSDIARIRAEHISADKCHSTAANA